MDIKKILKFDVIHPRRALYLLPVAFSIGTLLALWIIDNSGLRIVHGEHVEHPEQVELARQIAKGCVFLFFSLASLWIYSKLVTLVNKFLKRNVSEED